MSDKILNATEKIEEKRDLITERIEKVVNIPQISQGNDDEILGMVENVLDKSTSFKQIEDIYNTAREQIQFNLLRLFDIDADGKITKKDFIKIVKFWLIVFGVSLFFYAQMSQDTLMSMIQTGQINWEFVRDFVIFQSLISSFSVAYKLISQEREKHKDKKIEMVKTVLDKNKEKVEAILEKNKEIEELHKQIQSYEELINKMKVKFKEQLENLKWFMMLEFTSDGIQKDVKDVLARQSIIELEKLKKEYSSD